MRPRKTRWISIPEILDGLSKNYPQLAARLANKPRRRQLEAVRRLVFRAERRDSERYTKRVDGDIFVRVESVESLLPVDVTRVGEIERDVEGLHESHRDLTRKVNGHGSKLRDHEKRIVNTEEIQRNLADAQLAMAKATALLSRA